jgi:hypothetical protein
VTATKADRLRYRFGYDADPKAVAEVDARHKAAVAAARASGWTRTARQLSNAEVLAAMGGVPMQRVA